MTDSMKSALGETDRRRALQEAYNQEHGITPESIRKNIGELLSSRLRDGLRGGAGAAAEPGKPEERFRTVDELEKEIKVLEKEMRQLAKALEFEKAAEVRDRIRVLRQSEFGLR